MTMIEELYYGNIHPDDSCIEKCSPYDKALRIFHESSEKLLEHLKDQPESKWVIAMESAHSDMMAIARREQFLKGWHIGARLMIDTLV